MSFFTRRRSSKSEIQSEKVRLRFFNKLIETWSVPPDLFVISFYQQIAVNHLEAAILGVYTSVSGSGNGRNLFPNSITVHVATDKPNVHRKIDIDNNNYTHVQFYGNQFVFEDMTKRLREQIMFVGFENRKQMTTDVVNELVEEHDRRRNSFRNRTWRAVKRGAKRLYTWKQHHEKNYRIMITDILNKNNLFCGGGGGGSSCLRRRRRRHHRHRPQ